MITFLALALMKCSVGDSFAAYECKDQGTLYLPDIRIQSMKEITVYDGKTPETSKTTRNGCVLEVAESGKIAIVVAGNECSGIIK